MNKTFKQLGESVFGRGWQTKLSKTFKVNLRTVGRWAAGDAPVPENIMIALNIMKKDMGNDNRK